ncbi:hypothetical protein [Chryseobacterium caseinilyticum]|nr:hypothetical protein [Chryseobacterium caseinilyticum]
MKKLLTISTMLILGFANVQMTKGDWVISGNTGLGFNNTNSFTKV